MLLRETYRAEGKVKKRTLANLSALPTEVIEGLKVLLRGGAAISCGEEVLTIERSLPHGHVAAVLGSAQACGASAWFDAAVAFDQFGKERDCLWGHRVSIKSQYVVVLWRVFTKCSGSMVREGFIEILDPD